MQPKLYIERILDLKGARTNSEQIMVLLHKYLTEPSDIEIVHGGDKLGSQVDFTKIIYSKEISEEIKTIILQSLKTNTTNAQFAAIMHAYKLYPHKNYVVSRPLAKALASAQSDVPISIIDRDFLFYIEIPGLIDDSDGSDVLGTLVQSYHLKDLRVFRFVAFTRDRNTKVDTMRSAHWLINDERRSRNITIGKLQEEFDSAEVYEQHGKKTFEDLGLINYSYKEGITNRSIINAVCYALSDSEELIEEINSFATKKSKSEGQKKIYSELPYTVLGKNFELLRLQVADSTTVSSFWRWQPCGEGRQQRKFTLVREHERTYKKDL